MGKVDRLTMSNQTQDVKRTMFWLTVGMLAYFLCQWLMAVLVVRLADYSVAGDFSLIVTSSNIFAQIALFGMRPFQISDTRRQYTDRMYLVSRYATCGLSAVLFVGFSLFNGFTVYQNICFIIYSIYRLTEGGFDVLHGMMQNASRMDLAGKSLIIRGVAPLLLFCAALVLFGDLMVALAAITVFSLAWLALFDYTRAKKVSVNQFKSVNNVNFKKMWKLLVGCFPLVAGNLVYSLILFLPRYYIEGIYGREILGVYAAVSAPALVVPLFAQYIYLPYMPAISEHYLEHRKKPLLILIAKLTLAISLICVAVLLAGHFFGEWGLVILFGESIRGHSYLLTPIILSVICTAFVYFLNSIIISMRKNNIMLISSAVAVAFCFALSYMMVSSSLNGASFTLVMVQAAQIIVLFIGILLTLKKTKLSQ